MDTPTGMIITADTGTDTAIRDTATAIGYGYNDQGYGYGGRNRGGSSVGQLQRRLARAGYYHGAIDGIMGPETRRAIRAYERSHNDREYGMTDRY